MAHICHDLRRFSTLVGSRVLLCEVIKIAISGSAKSVLHFFNTKELIHEWYIHLQMRIVCVGWKAPCLKKTFCTLSLSSYQSPMLIVDNQGVAQRAHPNRRERWILKCTKLRQGTCLANNWFIYLLDIASSYLSTIKGLWSYLQVAIYEAPCCAATYLNNSEL